MSDDLNAEIARINDWHAETDVIREWINGGCVPTFELKRQLRHWLQFWDEDES